MSMFNWTKTATKELGHHDQEILWNFISTKPDQRELEDILWRLTYAPIETIQGIGIENLSKDVATKVRAEIANYFKGEMKWDFKKCAEQYEELESYKNLNKALKGDQYAIHYIIGACDGQRYLDERGIAYTINCLKSRWEETGYKGLNRLGFSQEEECKFLVPYRKQIAEFLSEIYKIDAEKYRPSLCEEMSKLHWSYHPDDLRDNSTDTQITAEQETNDEQGKTEDAITVNQVIEQKEEILKFLTMYDTFSELAWVTENRDKVCEYLEMLQKLPNYESILVNRGKVQRLISALSEF